MAIDYVIHWTDDSLKNPFKIPAQSTNTTLTSLVLSGKGSSTWAEFTQQNMIRLLENFATGNTPPPNPTVGQLWFNKLTNYLKIYWNGRWNDVGYNRIDSSVPPPSPNFPGDLWYDTSTDQLKVMSSGGYWDKVYQGAFPQPTPAPSGTPTPVVAPTPTPSPTPTIVSKPTLFSITPVQAGLGTYTVTITYNGLTGPGTIGYTISIPGINGNSASGTMLKMFGQTASNEFTKPTSAAVVTINGSVDGVQADPITVTFTSVAPSPVPVAPTPVPSPVPVAPTPVPSPVPTSTTPSGFVAPFNQNGSEYEVLWNDEFNTQTLSSFTWNDHIWYENSNPTKNYAVTADGCLKIWPQKDSTGNFFNRTIDTDGKKSMGPGTYIEFRAKLPRGKGLWPILWLYNHTVYPVGTVYRPEIDIMEAFTSASVDNGWSDTNDNPIAYETQVITGPAAGIAGLKQITTQTNLSSNFYHYAVKWTSQSISFYFEGVLKYTLNINFNYQMYLLISLWMGSASGPPDSTTPTGVNNSFAIDYVRVYKFLGTNDAKFVSQTVPLNGWSDIPFNVTIKMKNTGNVPWTLADGYMLESQDPTDNRTISPTGRIVMGETDVCLPGDIYTFTTTLHLQAGTYNFQWRMVKENSEWFGNKLFGDVTPLVVMNILPGSP